MANTPKETVIETLTAVVILLANQGVKAEINVSDWVVYLNVAHTTLIEAGISGVHPKVIYKFPKIRAANSYSITLCPAKSFQPDAKDLVAKLVANVMERCRELELERKREQVKKMRQASAEAGVANIVADYPQFSRALSPAGDGTLNLQFKGISESKAREILMILDGAKVTA